MTATQPPIPSGQGMTVLGGPPRGPVPLGEVAVLLDARDAVAIAKQPLLPRTVLHTEDGDIRVLQVIPPGHKVALRAVPEGGEVRRYGQIIGFATQDIEPGQHVIVRTSRSARGSSSTTPFCSEYQPVEYVPEPERRTFMGYRREDGRVGTRNYVAVLASVNCSSSRHGGSRNTSAQPERDARLPERRRRHRARHEGRLRRPLRIARPGHAAANARPGSSTTRTSAAYVILGLGCEVNQPTDLIEADRDSATAIGRPCSPSSRTAASEDGAGRRRRGEAAPAAREPGRARGGPRLRAGRRAAVRRLRRLVGRHRQPGARRRRRRDRAPGRHGVLGETTEIYGAEHLLTRRARRAGGRREADRAHPVVGVVHRAVRRRRSTTTRRPATRRAA